jgi:hypothetical protein
MTGISERLNIRDALYAKGLRRCGRCKELVSIANFHKNSLAEHGLSGYCKDCAREYSIERGDLGLSGQVPSTAYLDMTGRTKMCCTCRDIKPFESFFKCKRSKDGYDIKCKDCSNKTLKEWRKHNYKHSLEYHCEYAKEWRKKNDSEQTDIVITAILNRLLDMIEENKEPYCIFLGREEWLALARAGSYRISKRIMHKSAENENREATFEGYQLIRVVRRQFMHVSTIP